MLVPLQSRKGSSLKTWCGSSVGLEYRPVTPGVASSSLVRTAKKALTDICRGFSVSQCASFVPLFIKP